MGRTAVCLVIFSALISAKPSGPLAAAYANLPLSFERNVGQAGVDVLFSARGEGCAIDLTADGIAFRLHDNAGGEKMQPNSCILVFWGCWTDAESDTPASRHRNIC